MDFDKIFESAEFKAGLIIAILVVILLIVLLVLDGWCCAVGSKPRNYQQNMEMLENGETVSDKLPSAPSSDSNGFYEKNMREFNGK